MFCSECGKEATGKFCWNCGKPLHSADSPAAQEVSAPAAAANWQDEINYEALLRYPEVRDRLARVMPATSRLSGEDFLDSFGKIVHTPVSPLPVAKIAQDFYSRLGIHTGKHRSEIYQQQVGRVMVSALCALAAGGYKVKEARQATDGCILICEIPSDVLSFAGTLHISIERKPEGVTVNADTDMEGQLMDWGKSDRILNKLFDAIASQH